MKERPILFSTSMVQAILSGRKTMTRRVVKPQPFSDDFVLGTYNPIKAYLNGEQYPGPDTFGISNDWWSVKAKFGQIGDRIWVRETSCYVMLDHAHDLLEGAKERTQYVYKASVHPDWMEYARERYGYKWTPSIFMRREASRITLEITNIRVERLQDITEEDAINEGIECEPTGDYCFKNYQRGIDSDYYYIPAIESFRSLWQSINGKESWESNPYVWVIEFKKL